MLILAYHLVRVMPGGVMIMVAAIESLSEAVNTGYLVLTLGGDDLRRSLLPWREKIFKFRILVFSISLAHSLYFVSCGNVHWNCCLIGYNVLELALYPRDYSLPPL